MYILFILSYYVLDKIYSSEITKYWFKSSVKFNIKTYILIIFYAAYSIMLFLTIQLCPTSSG